MNEHQPIIPLGQSHETTLHWNLGMKVMVAVEKIKVVTARATTFKIHDSENCNVSPKIGGFATVRNKIGSPVVEKKIHGMFI